jgi:dephospho-CoA kinase
MPEPEEAPASLPGDAGQPSPKTWYPLILAAVLVVVDQITKAIIVANVPLFYESGFRIEVIGGFSADHPRPQSRNRLQHR